MDGEMHRCLGVFGPRNSGKTTFWACLYGSKGMDNGTAAFTDENTIRHLDPLWQTLANGEVVPATAQGDPQDLSFQFHSDAITWHVTTRDYSGNLVELAHLKTPNQVHTAEDLRRRITDWIRQCDAMLVLLPADLAQQDEESRLMFRRELETLLEAFEEADHPVHLPVCLAVTKADILPDRDDGHGESGEAEPEEALPGWMEELVCLVRNQVGDDRTRIFFTSAFGGHDDENPALPPSTGLRPRGLEPALLWAVRESDRCLFEGAASEAQRSLDRWPHRYKKALRRCGAVAAKGVPPENTQDLQSWCEKLSQALRRQRWRNGVAFTVAVLVLVGGGLYAHAKVLSVSAQSAMDVGTVTHNSLQDIRSFLESGNPLRPVFFGDELERAREWNEQSQTREANRVRDILATNADMGSSDTTSWNQRVKKAERRIQACRGYLELFPRGQDSADFQAQIDDAEALIADLQHYGPFDEAHSNLKTKFEDVQTAAQMRELQNQFIAQFPPETYPQRTNAYRWLRYQVEAKLLDDSTDRLKQQAKDIKTAYPTDPNEYPEYIGRIQTWLNEYSRNRTPGLADTDRELQRLRREIEEAWDKDAYKTLKTTADRMFEGPHKLEDSISYARDYLSTTRDTVAMKDHVKDWLDYARGLMKKQRIGLQPTHIDVTGTKFDDWASNSDMKITLLTHTDGDPEWSYLANINNLSFDNKTDLPDKTFYVSIPAYVSSVKIKLEEYDVIYHDEGSTKQRLLNLLETGQRVRSTSAEGIINVDGAKVTLIVSDLPERKDLPEYGSQR